MLGKPAIDWGHKWLKMQLWKGFKRVELRSDGTRFILSNINNNNNANRRKPCNSNNQKPCNSTSSKKNWLWNKKPIRESWTEIMKLFEFNGNKETQSPIETKPRNLGILKIQKDVFFLSLIAEKIEIGVNLKLLNRERTVLNFLELILLPFLHTFLRVSVLLLHCCWKLVCGWISLSHS